MAALLVCMVDIIGCHGQPKVGKARTMFPTVSQTLFFSLFLSLSSYLEEIEPNYKTTKKKQKTIDANI
jgi:hypothetical protein